MSKLADALEQMRDLPDDELRQALDRTRDELFRIQLGMHTNQVASPAELRRKRRDVAKILTILRARALGVETQAHGRKADRTAEKKGK
jgi:large subunit ribosomal protein L29